MQARRYDRGTPAALRRASLEQRALGARMELRVGPVLSGSGATDSTASLKLHVEKGLVPQVTIYTLDALILSFN